MIGEPLRSSGGEVVSRPLHPEWEPPVVLPPAWRMEERRRDGACYYSEILRLAVIVSCAKEQDGRWWVHLSVSHALRLPKWREVLEVRDIFLGNVYCYQVLPPREKHVNLHPNVLHLWHCLDEVPLPDFTKGGNTL